MRFNRARFDNYLMAFFIGCGMIVGGLSSTDKGWIVIGAIVVGVTLLFGAWDIYDAIRGSRREKPKEAPTPVVVVGSIIFIPLLAAYWYFTRDIEALIFAVLLAFLLLVLYLLRNTSEIAIAKIQLGDTIPPDHQEQGGATSTFEFTLRPQEFSTTEREKASSTPLNIAIKSGGIPVFTKEGDFLKGIVQAVRGNTDEAMDAFRKYGVARGDLPAMATGETVALLTGHRYEEAVAAADRAIAVQPSVVEWMLRGQALLALGATEEALADFQAAQRGGMTPGVETSIGATYFELGRTDEAILVLEKSRGDAGASSATFFYLGEAYRVCGRDAEANDAYDEAAARAIGETQYGTAWHRGVLPIALLRQGKMDGAEMAARDAVTLAPTDPTVRVARALVQVKRETPSLAQADLEEALAVNPHEVVKALSDPDFAPLLATKGGEELLERAKTARDAVLGRLRGRETAVAN